MGVDGERPAIPTRTDLLLSMRQRVSGLLCAACFRVVRDSPNGGILSVALEVRQLRLQEVVMRQLVALDSGGVRVGVRKEGSRWRKRDGGGY